MKERCSRGRGRLRYSTVRLGGQDRQRLRRRRRGLQALSRLPGLSAAPSLQRPQVEVWWLLGQPHALRLRVLREGGEGGERPPNFIVGSKISCWEGLPGGMGSAGPELPVIDLTEIAGSRTGSGGAGREVHRPIGGKPFLHPGLTQPDKQIPDYAYLHFWFQKELRRVIKQETVVSVPPTPSSATGGTRSVG